MQPKCAAGAATQRPLATVRPVHLHHASPQSHQTYNTHTSVGSLHTRSTPARGLVSQAPRLGSRSRRSTVQAKAFFSGWFKSDPSDATKRKYQSRVDAVNALESKMQALTDEQLQAKTVEFQKRVAGGETLEALLPEAFAVSGAQ